MQEQEIAIEEPRDFYPADTHWMLTRGLQPYPAPGGPQDITIKAGNGVTYRTAGSSCLWSLRGWDLFRSRGGAYFFAGEYEKGGQVIPITPKEAGDWLRRRKGVTTNIGLPGGPLLTGAGRPELALIPG